MPYCKNVFISCLLFASAAAQAVTVTDDFTQPTDNNQWVVMNYNGYPCLTAGANAPTGSSSVIPACTAISNSAGSGALRLTPASGNQHGAIVSSFTFPSNQGLQATFTTYAYGGSHDGLASDGADGMSFFLMDGSVPTTVAGGNNLGSYGGSLAYSCSNANPPYTGLTGGYLGLGMDEYGNYLNSGDNTVSGIPIKTTSSSSNGYNSFTSGSYMQANRIGLRGAGNVSWYWLNSNYPWYYPSSLSSANQQAAVQNTCKTGTLWNYGGAQSEAITALSSSGSTLTVTVPDASRYNNTDSVTIAGTITATSASQLISAATVSGTTMTVTVPSVSGYSNGNTVTIGGGITATGPALSASITGISRTRSGSNPNYTYTLTYSIPSGTGGFAVGHRVTVTGSNASAANVTNSTITAVTSTSFTVSFGSTSPGTSFSSPYGTATDNSQTATGPTVTGNYTISNLNTSNKTFTVTLSSAAASINNPTSGSVFVDFTIPGTYTIANVNTTTNTFTVPLGFTPASIGYTSGAATATDTTSSGVTQLATSIMDYSAIPGGYWVLPSTQLIADEGHSLRSGAWPITYRLQITPAGYLTFMYSYNGGAYQTVLSNWNMTTSNGSLPTNFRFGFAGSTGGSTNVHEITCFTAEPVQSSSSAAANTVQAGQIKVGTQQYLSSYNPSNWTGSLVSENLTVGSNNTVQITTIANWDASCVLTGGGCNSMGTTSSTVNGVTTTTAINTITAQTPASRVLFTWSGTAGIPLKWANITAAQQTLLNSTDSNGQYRLNWLRGDRTEEQSTNPPGPLRIRAGVLGDIIDSSPTWVGPPSLPYSSAFSDALYGTTGTESSYTSFKSSYATRTNVVYSGSNDGLLHGFRAGANTSGGSYDATNNDGQEVLGFMPSTILANANIVSLTNPTYLHGYFVDATPGSGDLYYGGAWHTWLVGSLGAGGGEIYALDVTDPTQFSEANASTLVKGDWTSSTLTNLGTSTTGTPLIRRLHNGKWAIIFGNGLGSSGGVAGVYIGLVNSTTGAVTFKWMAVPAQSSSNGITSVASGDFDADHVIDYLYAGDLLGNVWRFDLTSSNSDDWAVSTYGQPTAAPLFIAKDGSGNRQPITTQLMVTNTVTGGYTRVLLGFGTGQATPNAATAINAYASGTQSVYGIWDWDMNTWNNGRTTARSIVIPPSLTKLATLPEITTSPYRTFTRSDLYVDTNVVQTSGYATMATAIVCWNGSSACPSTDPVNTSTTNTQYGWLFDLQGMVNGQGEQIIYNPTFSGGELVVNTTIAPTTTLGQCSPVLPTGWTRAFNMASGGGNKQNVFPNPSNSNDTSTNSDSGITGTAASVVAVQQNGVGTPWVVSVGTQQVLLTQVNNGAATTLQFNPMGNVTINRITWQELL